MILFSSCKFRYNKNHNNKTKGEILWATKTPNKHYGEYVTVLLTSKININNKKPYVTGRGDSHIYEINGIPTNSWGVKETKNPCYSITTDCIEYFVPVPQELGLDKDKIVEYLYSIKNNIPQISSEYRKRCSEEL